MSVSLPEGVRRLFDGKNFANVATLMPDGSPQVSPVWAETKGDRIVFNTAEGRVKPNNIRRDSRVAVSVADQENPYRAAFVRGRVVDIRGDGADAHIDKLAKQYMAWTPIRFASPAKRG